MKSSPPNVRPFEAPQGRPPKYPWDVWADGAHRVILKGRDFDLTVPGMAGVLRAHAVRKGLKVTCALNPDAGEIEFRFYEHDQKRRAA